MGYIEQMDGRVKRFGVIDVRLAQGAAIFLVLLIVKFVPQVLAVNAWSVLALTIVCAAKPVCVAFVSS